MSVIDKLIEAGRDPLEALLGESTEEERERLDKVIVRELKNWSPAMLKRLREMVEQRAEVANEKCRRLEAAAQGRGMVSEMDGLPEVAVLVSGLHDRCERLEQLLAEGLRPDVLADENWRDYKARVIAALEGGRHAEL